MLRRVLRRLCRPVDAHSRRSRTLSQRDAGPPLPRRCSRRFPALRRWIRPRLSLSPPPPLHPGQCPSILSWLLQNRPAQRPRRSHSVSRTEERPRKRATASAPPPTPAPHPHPPTSRSADPQSVENTLKRIHTSTFRPLSKAIQILLCPHCTALCLPILVLSLDLTIFINLASSRRIDQFFALYLLLIVAWPVFLDTSIDLIHSVHMFIMSGKLINLLSISTLQGYPTTCPNCIIRQRPGDTSENRSPTRGN